MDAFGCVTTLLTIAYFLINAYSSIMNYSNLLSVPSGEVIQVVSSNQTGSQTILPFLSAFIKYISANLTDLKS